MLAYLALKRPAYCSISLACSTDSASHHSNDINGMQCSSLRLNVIKTIEPYQPREHSDPTSITVDSLPVSTDGEGDQIHLYEMGFIRHKNTSHGRCFRQRLSMNARL